jgi:long-chain acyl-CoA synthetase
MTIRTLLDRAVSLQPNRFAIRYHHNGTWHSKSYKDLLTGVKQMAEVFGRIGLKAGDDRVALILDNGVAWVESYLALTGVGAQVVPLDPKLREEEVAYILKNSEASLVLTDLHHRALLEAILPSLPQVQGVIFTDDPQEAIEPLAGRLCYSYEALRRQFASGDLSFYDKHGVAPQDVASIIYTSGTTGKPKGALLTHNNFCSDAEASLLMMKNLATETDDFLVVLPLFHSLSFLANFILPLTCAAGMFFVESLRTVTQDIQVLRPTIIIAVPLLVEKILARIQLKVSESRSARLLLKLGLGRVVGWRVLKNLGGRLRLFVVGGAPCPPPLLLGFQQLGISVLEGYGLTECSPVVSINPLSAPRIGTVGIPIANIKVRLAEMNDQGVGELQVRGPIVMKGYFKDLEATRETFDGDWLKTGDLATIDGDGYISICGRKKALIVNREGKNIYPEEVENVLSGHPFIADIVVIGYRVGKDSGERVGGLITPHLENIIAANNGVEPEWSSIEKIIHDAVRDRSVLLADYKHIRKLRLQREPLERTSVQKIRRVAYQGALDE